MATAVSPQGAAFTENNEGFVSHFYRDSGGVGTIGNGFTAMSKVFNDYWLQTRGHKLRAGDTITKDESVMLLQKVMNAEYAPPVARKYGDALLQNEFDAVADAVYNCGAGTLKDHWAAALPGNLSAAATDLLTTRITAGGRRLAGLVTRRSREAKLLLHGDYNGALVETTEPDTLSADLAALGYGSVSEFQKANPPLDVDGNAGPATRAAVARALAAKKAKTVAIQAAPAGTVTGAGAGAATAPAPAVVPDPATVSHAVAMHSLYWGVGLGLAALAAVAIGYLIYSNRGRILGKRTPA